MSGRIQLNVGGKKFQTINSTLSRFPGTLLDKLDPSSQYYSHEKNEYFFDRNPKVFATVLEYYRTGELHLPTNVCGSAVKRELDFWGISHLDISQCCWHQYTAFQEQANCIKRIEAALNDVHIPPGQECKLKNKIRCKIWSFVDDPSSSKAAKIYSWAFGAWILLAVVLTIMESMEDFRIPNGTKPSNDTGLPTDANHKIYLYSHTDPIPAIQWLGFSTFIFFSLEFILRFVLCPSKKKFLKSFFNIIDIIALFPRWVRFVIEKINPNHRSHPILFWVTAYLSLGEVFRVLRLLKLAKNVTGLKILLLTIRASLTEIGLLLFLMTVGSAMFAVFIFYSEIWIDDTFPDMASGSYWAFITMTTVGYGDMYPKGHQGKIIGVMCAIIGTICTGLPIPIIANNFSLFYSYARTRKCMKIGETKDKNTHPDNPDEQDSQDGATTDVHINEICETQNEDVDMCKVTTINPKENDRHNFGPKENNDHNFASNHRRKPINQAWSKV